MKIELWPKGNPEAARLLGVATISNDGTSIDIKKGNYNVELSHAGKYMKTKTGAWKTGRLENHRRSLSPYHLVCKALKSALNLK